ncbi:MAG: response regulator [Chloroflexota bacterium]|nr:response regulator [Chloroflexota bacterium]
MSRILFVDDDPGTLQLIELVLGRQGHQVFTASNGVGALRAMQDNLPDLVLLDLMMPVMDGYEVCRHVRTDPRTAHVPIVVLSAKAQVESQVEAFRCGVDGYLVKPIRPSELIERIEAVLERAAPMPLPTAPGTAIGILGSQGGVGTTMVAVNVAAALVAEREVVLTDFVPDGSVSVHLGLETSRGIGALLSCHVESIGRATVSAEMVDHPSGLHVLSGSVSALPSLDTYRAKAILAALSDMAKVTVVDLGCRFGPIVRAALPYCGAIALVVGSDRVALTQAQRILVALFRTGIAGENVLPVCVNRWGAARELDESAVSAQLEHPLYAVIDCTSEEFYRAIQQGVPLVLGAPESPTSQVLKALAHEIYRSAQASGHKENQ